MTSFFSSTVEGMANVARVSGYLGISTNALEELRYAAQKSGVSIDILDDSLKELQIRAVDAKSGSGEAAEAFQYLGMSSTDASGRMREPLELLSEVADRLKTLPTQNERIWVLDSMLGNQGAEMLKMLEGGSDGLKAMRLEAKAMGIALDKDAASNAIQNHSNQSVSVAVNVKTGALPHEIGGEVAKAVRREMDKERQNAFMWGLRPSPALPQFKKCGFWLRILVTSGRVRLTLQMVRLLFCDVPEILRQLFLRQWIFSYQLCDENHLIFLKYALKK